MQGSVLSAQVNEYYPGVLGLALGSHGPGAELAQDPSQAQLLSTMSLGAGRDSENHSLTGRSLRGYLRHGE